MNKKEFPWALAMIQPEPLPGSYLNKGMSFDEVINRASDEVAMLDALGFDGYTIQNRNDAPVCQVANPETIAYMSVLSYILKQRFPSLIQGILVNWDGIASLAVAEAAGADFIRVEHTYTGVEIGYAGIMQPQCVEICMLKKRLGSSMPIYADVQEIHYKAIGAKPIPESARDIVFNAFADGLYLGGATPDESLKMLADVRKIVGAKIPIMLSGGATGDNVTELLKHYDGVSVGTWVKNGNMRNPIDKDRAAIFIKNVAAAREFRQKNK